MVFALAACGSSNTPANDTPATAANTADNAEEPVSGKITFLTNRTDLDTDGTYEALIAKFNEAFRAVPLWMEQGCGRCHAFLSGRLCEQGV